MSSYLGGNSAIPHTPSTTAAPTNTHHSAPLGLANQRSATSHTTDGMASASPKNVNARQSSDPGATSMQITPEDATQSASSCGYALSVV